MGRGSYLDTCVLVSLFHNDAGYGAAEHWLACNHEAALWISHWVLLEFALAGWCTGRIWTCGLQLVSADRILVAAAPRLGVKAQRVPAPDLV